MEAEYLLDTNAYFNLLKEARDYEKGETSLFSNNVAVLKSAKLYISTVTKVEIISVIGKHSRGKSGGFQRCSRYISGDGTLCQNQWYVQPVPRWNNRRIRSWIQLVKETTNGSSPLLSIDLLPFNDHTIRLAEDIIRHALTFNFASMDALIAATAKDSRDAGHNLEVITSDKGLISCLNHEAIPVWDAFHV